MRFVVDTNIWIKFLQGNQRVHERLQRAMAAGDEVVVTPVAYYEVMRGLEKRGDQESIARIRTVWDGLTYVEARREVWDEAVRLWVLCVKQNQKRDDADTILAAFTSVFDAVIVTADRHFDVFDFQVQNWASDSGDPFPND